MVALDVSKQSCVKLTQEQKGIKASMRYRCHGHLTQVTAWDRDESEMSGVFHKRVR